MSNKSIKTEKGSIKDVVIDNRGKIIAGASAVVIGALGYIIYKERLDYNQLSIRLREAHEKADILAEALSEGVFEEAIATTTRKLNSRKDRLNYLINNNDETNEIVVKLKGEIEVLTRRRDAFNRAQTVLGISE